MTVAVLADIHGNIVALEAVLQDLEQQGGVDHIVVAGDLFTFGPAPNQVLTRLRRVSNIHFLLGNTDRYLLEGTYPSASTNDDWQDKLLVSFHWTAERLEDEGLHFLRTLPAFQIIPDAGWQLLAVHGSPRSDEEGLTSKTQPHEFEDMSIPRYINVLACGHTHIPMNRTVGTLRVVNAGSVGLPFDGDPRACYAIISGSTASGDSPVQVQLRRIVYDVEKVVEQFYACNHPAADIGAYNLRTARSIGSDLIYTPEMRLRNSSFVVSEE
ncbi:MAG: metallophosphoesterase family protein [Anaerolineae bacterium]